MSYKGEDQHLTKYLSMLKYQGLWFFPGQPWSGWKVWQVTRVVTIWMFSVLNFISISNYSFGEALVKPYLSFIGFTLATGVFTAIFYLQRHAQLAFCRGMQEFVADRPDLFEEFKRVTAQTWKYNDYILMSIWTFIILVAGSPILLDVCLALFTDSDRPFVVPMLLEGFLPEDRSASFYFISVLHFVLLANSVTAYGGVITCLPAIASYAKFHLRTVVIDLALWAEDRRRPHRKEELRRIVKEHDKILGLVAIAKTIIGPCFALQNFLSSINISLLLHFAKKALIEGDYMVVAQNIYTVFFQVTCCYLSCLIGEGLRTQGREIHESLYMSGWEEEDPDTRRTLLMMMVAAKREIIIDFKNKMSLKLETFTELMNTSYSIFMLMESMN